MRLDDDGGGHGYRRICSWKLQYVELSLYSQ